MSEPTNPPTAASAATGDLLAWIKAIEARLAKLDARTAAAFRELGGELKK